MHTPIPWQTGKSCDGFLTITDGSKTICTVGEADLFDGVEDDAALIVKAVNSYEAIIGFLDHIQDLAMENAKSPQDGYAMIEEWARKALALAEGKE